jgi:hypothetical protein
MIGVTIIIEGIKFKIISFDMIRSNIPYGGIASSYHMMTTTEIKMVAETNIKYYMQLENWIDLYDNNGKIKPPFSFKKDITKNGIQLFGIFPKDYIFKDNNIIEVTFSIDYMNGDINKLKLSQERREKLIKLNAANNN